MNPIIFLLAAIIVSAAAITGGVFLRKFFLQKFYRRALKMRLLLVRLPQDRAAAGGEQKEPLADLNTFGQLLAALSTLKQPFVFEIAVHNVGEAIHFYVAAAEESLEYVMRAIHGLYPEALVEQVDDYTIFDSQGTMDGAYLKQKEARTMPIRTYAEAKLDTFAPVIGAFTRIKEVGEGLALQIVVKPAPKFAKKNIEARVKELKKGEKGEEKKGVPAAPPVIDEDALRTLHEKIGKQLFAVNVRLVSSARTEERAQSLLESLAAAFAQFNAPHRNSFRVVRPRRLKSLAFEYSFRTWNDQEMLVLGTDELASIVHFPSSSRLEPKVRAIKSREAPPPEELPKEGVTIGESVFRGERKAVKITEDDRRRHVYIVGQTGTGKSSLMIGMAAADIAAGKGVAVIDPHGDLIEAVLSRVPRERANDVVLFDPADIERPIGLNMLEYNQSRPEEKTFIVNEMIGIFEKLFDLKATGGPMFEQYTRNALLLLMDDPDEHATLMEVPRVFTDVEYRKRLVAKAKNPVVVDFWEKEAVKAGGEASLANMTPYITSKFNNFIANDYVRPIIGQPRSAINFRAILDEGKILLVNLSKGRIGDINANLLGMIVVGKLLMAALSRADVAQEQRRDFNLFIDEFQNFTTDSIATILSEARKYRLNLVIAHQFIGQLTEKIRDAVFGNVGSQIVFRVGADDAEFLVKQFEPVFAKGDLLNIDNFNAYVKLLIAGQTSRPFNLRTLPPPKGTPEISRNLHELSRTRFGADRAEVEQNILTRLRT